ncbi:hypothetical protein HKBW3S34_02490 [Candidatus Hakubella thermalkaliphila]|nr:hypothetical protein HKBW3S34_02490 [Candidatus Hakubella thermalkaliphila]
MAFFLKEQFVTATATLEHLGMASIDLFKLNSAQILDTVRLAGIWALNSGYKGDPYFPWASAYSSPILVAISFLMPLLAFFPLLVRRNKYVLFFSLLTLLAFFVIKGPYPPLGGVIISLFTIANGKKLFT